MFDGGEQPVLLQEDGENETYAFWQIQGNIDLAMIPASTIQGISHALPIRLQNGYAKGKNGFGYRHILNNHGHQFRALRPPQDVFGFIVKKLSQGGTFHYQNEKRKSLCLTMQPSGVIILDYISKGKDSFFTIVTAYTTNRSVDGMQVGRYLSAYQVKPSA